MKIPWQILWPKISLMTTSIIIEIPLVVTLMKSDLMKPQSRFQQSNTSLFAEVINNRWQVVMVVHGIWCDKSAHSDTWPGGGGAGAEWWWGAHHYQSVTTLARLTSGQQEEPVSAHCMLLSSATCWWLWAVEYFGG